MKKFVKLLTMIFCAVSLVLFAAGCGEKTFESVPWGSTDVTSSQILTNLSDARTTMESARLQTKYGAVTTYDFFDTGKFTQMQVREETTFSLQFGTKDTCSVVETSKYIDGVLTLFTSDIYVANGAISTVYRTQKTYLNGEMQSEIKTKFNASIPPQNVYTKFIFIQQDTLSNVAFKNFDDVDYYRFGANSNECNALMSKFSQVDNLQSNPEMFALNDRSTDLLMNYNVEYGISSKNYITHFALSYNLENDEKSSQNSFDTFLKFSTTVNLEQYGVAVEFPQKPNDRDYM